MSKLEIKSAEDFEKITPEITELFLTEDFNEPLNNVPYWIKKIEFNINSEFNYPIDLLPEGLEELILPSYKIHTNEELGNLPRNLKVLELGGEHNQEIKENILPESLTHLTFGWDYDQEMKPWVLPDSLTHLTFGCYYNREFKENVLPNSFTHITFGSKYNQEIKEGVLPKSLTHLTLCRDYNQEIKEGVLPKSLTHLNFDLRSEFNCPVDLLPEGLEQLMLPYHKNHTIEELRKLPINLKVLKLGGIFN